MSSAQVPNDDSQDAAPTGGASTAQVSGATDILDSAVLAVAYVPDFLPESLLVWFVPNREQPTACYLEFVGEMAENWQTYYTKKGFQFVTDRPAECAGPFRVDPAGFRFEILEPGRFLVPKPHFRISEAADPVPLPGLEKRRPINPWKPNYIQATTFIKKYDWPHPVPRAVHYAVWEIEECGQIAGSTSWKNAESILRAGATPEVLSCIADIFYNRPEDYPLGSEVYLRILGSSGDDGFAKLAELAKHPISRKRKMVAQVMGGLVEDRYLPHLIELLEDEDPDVRRTALRSIGRVGVSEETTGAEKVAAYLESDELPYRVWAAQALCKGGNDSYRKFFIGLIKEEPRLLSDMGELGDVLHDLELYQAVPFLIDRLKHEKAEFRSDAAEALERLTEIPLEYKSIDSQQERRDAIKLCERWWKDYKKRRSGR